MGISLMKLEPFEHLGFSVKNNDLKFNLLDLKSI